MEKKRIVIVGAVALGPKTACRVKRLMPQAEVTMIDQDEYISYGGCGIPYFISGDVSEIRELMSTSFHMLRNPQFFEDTKDVRVLVRTRVTDIDRKAKTVRTLNLDTGKEKDIPYDNLVLATGSIPNRLPIRGADLPQVLDVTNLHTALAVKERIAKGEVDKAVIIGAGAIGCEMAEAFCDLWGLETSMVEIADQVLPIILDRNLARMVQSHMGEKGVQIHLREMVREILPGNDDHAVQVVTDKRTIHADLVITSVGVRPNSELAQKAGLAVSPKGTIMVNQRMQTSDPDIYAGGDCVEVMHLITGKPVYFPQGSLANRQGRVIGSNLAGRFATFPGVVGSFSIKIFDLAVVATGLALQTAIKEGFDAQESLVIQADRAHFYPTQELMSLQLIVDRKTQRVLGAQGVGPNGDAILGRINPIAAILPHRPTLEDVSNMEVAYAPPYASAMDIVNAAANNAENILDGLNKVVSQEEFEKCFLQECRDDALCLDVRGKANADPYVAHFPDRWINVPQETIKYRMEEIPRDKKLFVICNAGGRSYEALRQLNTAGIHNAVNVQGGVIGLKKCGLVNLEEDEEKADE